MHRCWARARTRTPRARPCSIITCANLAHDVFLDLEPARERVDESRQLAEPEDPIAGHVVDVHLAEERQEVVRADRVEGDLVHLHRARPLTGCEHARGLQDRARIDLVAREQLAVRARDPFVATRLGEPAQCARVVRDLLREPFHELHPSRPSFMPGFLRR
jgi:hypothetical protein